MKKNLNYATPSLGFIEYASEGVLCQSGLLEGWVEESIDDIAAAAETVIEIPSVEL